MSAWPIPVAFDDAFGTALQADYARVGDDALCDRAHSVRLGRAWAGRLRTGAPRPGRPSAAGPMLRAIALDHHRGPRQLPPPGWVAASRLLASGDAAVTGALLASVRDWTTEDQRSFLEWCIPRGMRAAGLDELLRRFGYHLAVPLSG